MMMYTNQNRRFPVILRWGHKYIMVAIKLDGNYIDAKCLKACKANELIKADQINNVGKIPKSSF